jgi:hypothetical protein
MGGRPNVSVGDDFGTAGREAYNRAHGDLWLKSADELESLFDQAKLSEAAQLSRAVEMIGLTPSKRLAQMLESDGFDWDRTAALIEREAQAGGHDIPEAADRIINPRWDDAPGSGLPMSEDIEALQRAHAAGGDGDPHMLASEIGWALRDLDADKIGRVMAGEGELSAQANMAAVRLGYQRMRELGVESRDIPRRIAQAMVANGVKPSDAEELTMSAVRALEQGGMPRPRLEAQPQFRDRDWIDINQLPPAKRPAFLAGARMQGEVGEPVYASNVDVGQFRADGSRRSALRGIANPVRGTSRFADENPWNGGAQVPFEANDGRDYPIGMDAEPLPSVSAALSPVPRLPQRRRSPRHPHGCAADRSADAGGIGADRPARRAPDPVERGGRPRGIGGDQRGAVRASRGAERARGTRPKDAADLGWC